MGKLNENLTEALRFAARRFREAERQGRENGYPNSSELFYTDTCPKGVYLAGVLTDKEIESKKQKRNTG